MQSKDLMVEVLTKTEKYINDEEALLSKQRSFFFSKGKEQGQQKKITKPQETGRQGQILKKEQRKQRAVPDKGRERQVSQGTTSA